MTRNWLQALAVVLVTGVVVFALGWGLLTWQTASTRFLEPAPMTTAAPATVDQGNALDAALDGALDGGGTVTTNALGNQMETQRKRAADGLVDGFMKLMIITTAVALGWTLLAWAQVSKVGRPETQRNAQGVWLVGYLVVTVAAAVLLWLTFNRQGPAAEATATATGGFIAGSIVLTWLSYYVSTALAAPAVLRASVPMATVLIPIGRSR